MDGTELWALRSADLDPPSGSTSRATVLLPCLSQ